MIGLLGAVRVGNLALIVATLRGRPSVPDLTISGTAAFNSTNALPAGILYQSIGADADNNGNRQMDAGEFEALIGSGTGRRFAAQVVYDTLGNVAQTSVTITRRRFLPDIITLTETPTPSFQLNDLTVTVNSANGLATFRNIANFERATGRNHSNMADRQGALTVIGTLPRLR